MARPKTVKIEVPGWLRRFRFPKALDHRLTALLDMQDRGEKLTAAERKEAEGLVEVEETILLFKLSIGRAASRRPK